MIKLRAATLESDPELSVKTFRAGRVVGRDVFVSGIIMYLFIQIDTIWLPHKSKTQCGLLLSGWEKNKWEEEVLFFIMNFKESAKMARIKSTFQD